MLRGFEHAGPQLAVVGQREAAEELDRVLAVGGDQGDIGAVGGRAAHQTQDLLQLLFCHCHYAYANPNADKRVAQ